MPVYKPKDGEGSDVTAAVYRPPLTRQSFGELTAVAQLSDKEAEACEARFPRSGRRVLVVRGSTGNYAEVEEGGYLVYHHDDELLFTSTGEDMAWYVPR